MSRALVDCSVFIHKLRPDSILVSELGRIGPDGNVLNGIFLPLSKIEIEDSEQDKLDKWDAGGGPPFNPKPLVLTIGVPEWLAMREGLI